MTNGTNRRGRQTTNTVHYCPFVEGGSRAVRQNQDIIQVVSYPWQLLSNPIIGEHFHRVLIESDDNLWGPSVLGEGLVEALQTAGKPQVHVSSIRRLMTSNPLDRPADAEWIRIQLHLAAIDKIRVFQGKPVGPDAGDFYERHWKASQGYPLGRGAAQA